MNEIAASFGQSNCGFLVRVLNQYFFFCDLDMAIMKGSRTILNIRTDMGQKYIVSEPENQNLSSFIHFKVALTIEGAILVPEKNFNFFGLQSKRLLSRS